MNESAAGWRPFDRNWRMYPDDRRLHHLYGGSAAVHGIVIDFVAMHIGDVARVDTTPHGLQIVALLQPLRDEDMACRQIAPLDTGWRRFFFLRPHIGPDDAGALDAGITSDPHGRAAA